MYFKSIQFLRAFGAIYVMLYHLIHWWDRTSDAFTGLFDNGYGAIDLFFVISGFVVFQSVCNAGNGLKAFSRFFAKRLIRIYPLYWIFLLFFLFTGILNMQGMKTESVYKTFFLLPGHTPVIDTSWTLQYEIYFYLIIGLFILGKRWQILQAALFLLSLTAFLSGIFSSILGWHLPTQGFYNEFVFEFFLGAIAVQFFKRIPLSISFFLVISGTILFLFPIKFHSSHVLAFGVPSLFILVGLTNLEYRQKIKIPKFLVMAGNASYCLYLIHVPILFYILFHPAIAPWSTNRIFLVVLSIAICALSIFVHYYLEKPMQGYLNQRIFRTSIGKRMV
jgi:exopolysaccharide production protein ExoZ